MRQPGRQASTETEHPTEAERPAPARRIGRRAKLGFALAVTLGLLALVEVGQRISDNRKAAKRSTKAYSLRPETTDGHPISDKPGGLVLRLHPHLVYRMKPNQRLRGLTINAQGYRGAPWSRDKRAGVQRVVLLGGSTAFGHGASDDAHTPAAAMEAALNAGSRMRWEVLNAAVMTYDSRQELVQLTTELVHYAPDWVVVLDGWNDFYHAGLEAPDRPLFHLMHREVERALARGRDRLRGLIAWSAVYRGIERRRDRRPDTTRTFGRYADRPDALAAYSANLRGICRTARAHGARCLLAAQPELFQRRAPVPPVEQAMRDAKGAEGYADYAAARYPRFVAAARTVATAEDAAFTDMTTLFDATNDVLFTDRVHVNDEGSRRLGQHLAHTLLTHTQRP